MGPNITYDRVTHSAMKENFIIKIQQINKMICAKKEGSTLL